MKSLKHPSEYNSQLIAVLRFPMACGIVLLHAQFPGKVGDLISNHSLLSGIVPLFFVISGYLFYGQNDRTNSQRDYCHMLLHKAKALLIPYLAWNIVAISLLACQQLLHLYNNPDIIPVYAYGIKEWLHALGISNTGTPQDFPLWYCQDLMLIFLISPIVSRALDKASMWILPILLLLICCHLSGLAARQYEYAPIIERTTRLFSSISWFALGVFFAKSHISRFSFEHYLNNSFLFSVLFVLCMCSGYAHLVTNINVMYMIAMLSSCIVCLHFGCFLLKHYPFLTKKHWACSSFFLYCSHVILGGYLGKAGTLLHINVNSWIVKSLITVTVIIISDLGCRMTERNKILSLLFLGRKAK